MQLKKEDQIVRASILQRRGEIIIECRGREVAGKGKMWAGTIIGKDRREFLKVIELNRNL